LIRLADNSPATAHLRSAATFMSWVPPLIEIGGGTAGANEMKCYNITFLL
jgi:hypothetical protein